VSASQVAPRPALKRILRLTRAPTLPRLQVPALPATSPPQALPRLPLQGRARAELGAALPHSRARASDRRGLVLHPPMEPRKAWLRQRAGCSLSRPQAPP